MLLAYQFQSTLLILTATSCTSATPQAIQAAFYNFQVNPRHAYGRCRHISKSSLTFDWHRTVTGHRPSETAVHTQLCTNGNANRYASIKPSNHGRPDDVCGCWSYRNHHSSSHSRNSTVHDNQKTPINYASKKTISPFLVLKKQWRSI